MYWRLGTTSLADARRQIEVGLVDRIARAEVKRLSYWTESLGVGSREFLEKHRALILSRMETEIVEVQGHEVSVLREKGAPYGQELAPKSAAKASPKRHVVRSNI